MWPMAKTRTGSCLIQTSSRNLRSKTFNGGIMKKTIVTLVCLLIAPLAFAQTSSKSKRHGLTTTEPITVTGTIITTTTEEGATASYQPFKTLVVRVDGSNNPRRYVLDGTGHVVNKAGGVVPNAITTRSRRPGHYMEPSGFREDDHA